MIDDYDVAVTNPALATALTVVDLLAEGGDGPGIVRGFTPLLSKQAYLELQRSFNRRALYEE
jgi:hypothetical protein